jgi:hypothetical protein
MAAVRFRRAGASYFVTERRQLDLGWLLRKPGNSVELPQTMIDVCARVVMPMRLRVGIHQLFERFVGFRQPQGCHQTSPSLAVHVRRMPCFDAMDQP